MACSEEIESPAELATSRNSWMLRGLIPCQCGHTRVGATSIPEMPLTARNPKAAQSHSSPQAIFETASFMQMHRSESLSRIHPDRPSLAQLGEGSLVAPQTARHIRCAHHNELLEHAFALLVYRERNSR